MLRGAGYRTAYFGKWHLGKDPVGTAGWDEDFGVTGPETTNDAELTRRGLAFLEKAGEGERPFALFLSYNNPHDVYHFGREDRPAPKGRVTLPGTWHRKDLSTTPSVQKQFMAEDQGKVIYEAPATAWQRYREIYRDKVRLYDDELGRVLAGLDDAGLRDNTLVVATSDHGDMDAQHRLIYKGPFMYEHMVRVPLVIRMPGREASVSAFPTVNVDLVPTLAEIALTEAPAPPAPPATDGVSLVPLLRGEGEGQGQAPGREFVIGQYYSKQRWVNPIRMIRTRRHKYNLYSVHGEELYDLERDPSELHNAAPDGAYAEIKAELAETLAAWMAENGDPFDSLCPTTREGEALPGRGPSGRRARGER